MPLLFRIGKLFASHSWGDGFLCGLLLSFGKSNNCGCSPAGPTCSSAQLHRQEKDERPHCPPNFKGQRGPGREHNVSEDGNCTKGIELCKLLQSGEGLEKDNRGFFNRNGPRGIYTAGAVWRRTERTVTAMDLRRRRDFIKAPRLNHGKSRDK